MECKPCLTLRLFLKVSKKYLHKAYQYYVEPLRYKHSAKFREQYKQMSYAHMLSKGNTNFSAYNPVIDTIYGIGSIQGLSRMPVAVGYRKFKTKEEARAKVLEAISMYKPKFSDYLAELRSHSRVNQYVCVISEMKKSEHVSQVTPEEAYRKTMEMIHKRSSWVNDIRESDAEKQRKAVETGQIDKIINCDSVSTYVPKPKGGQNG